MNIFLNDVKYLNLENTHTFLYLALDILFLNYFNPLYKLVKKIMYNKHLFKINFTQSIRYV
jgi:hypothetical protein